MAAKAQNKKEKASAAEEQDAKDTQASKPQGKAAKKEVAAKESGKQAQRASEKAKDAKDAKKKKAQKANKKPNIFRRLADYLHAVRLELKRVNWPTAIEVRNRTLTVLFALVFFGLLIYAVDTVVSPALLAYSHLLG